MYNFIYLFVKLLVFFFCALILMSYGLSSYLTPHYAPNKIQDLFVASSDIDTRKNVASTPANPSHYNSDLDIFATAIQCAKVDQRATRVAFAAAKPTNLL